MPLSKCSRLSNTSKSCLSLRKWNNCDFNSITPENSNPNAFATAGIPIAGMVGDQQAAMQRFEKALEAPDADRVAARLLIAKLKINVQVIAATNKNLQELIGKGLFREDLFYRLAVAQVELPSLTQRRDDIVPIALHFLLEFNRKFGRSFSGFSGEAREAMMRHPWKGNVRELRNFVERGVLVGKEPELTRENLGLGGQDLSGEAPSSAGEILQRLLPPEGVDLGMAHESVDRHYFREALLAADGNETQAAQLLRINYSTFRYRRRKLGL